jgi:hypothetical protein
MLDKMKRYKDRDRKLWKRKHGQRMDKSLKRLLVDLIYKGKK